MNIKVIVVLFCVSIFTFGSISAITATPIDNLDLDPEISEKIENLLETANITFGDNFFITNGPVSKTYSKVELLEGKENQINKINRYLNRKFLRPLIFLRQVPVFVENLSFTVEFKSDVKIRSRFEYFTGNASVNWNETTGEFEGIRNFSYIFNKAHKVRVDNMIGFFVFQRIRLFDRHPPLFRKFFQPAKFIFIGFCDKIIYL